MIPLGVIGSARDPGPRQAGTHVPEGGQQLLGSALGATGDAEERFIGSRTDTVNLRSIRREDNPPEPGPMIAGDHLDGLPKMILDCRQQAVAALHQRLDEALVAAADTPSSRDDRIQDRSGGLEAIQQRARAVEGDQDGRDRQRPRRPAAVLGKKGAMK